MCVNIVSFRSGVCVCVCVNGTMDTGGEKV